MGALKDFFDFIQDIANAKVETIDPSIFDHPIASKTSWTALHSGGNKKPYHIMKQDDRGGFYFAIKTKAVSNDRLSSLAYYFTGIVTFTIIFGIFPSIQQLVQEEGRYIIHDYLFRLFMLLPLVAMIIKPLIKTILLLNTKTHYFDQTSRCMHSILPNQLPKDNMIQSLNPLSYDAIAGIQIIPESVYEDNHTDYISYEINLVLNDASRIHIIDHGDYDQLLNDAKKLAKLIGVPLRDVVQQRIIEQ